MLHVNQQDVDILVNDKPLRKIAHNGKLYIIAQKGREYTIRLRNNSGSRVTGVCSVDGLNVISGEPANEKDAGYIVNGLGSYIIKGFRTSDEEVHPFVFGDKKGSYANRSENGDMRDCGVIGAVFWGEEPKTIPYTTTYIPEVKPNYPYRGPDWPFSPFGPKWGDTWGDTTCDSSLGDMNRCMLSVSNCASFDTGTHFSDRKVLDRVTSAEFNFDKLLTKIEIYYATKKALRAMGVPVDQASSVSHPRAFRNTGYCKPPR